MVCPSSVRKQALDANVEPFGYFYAAGHVEPAGIFIDLEMKSVYYWTCGKQEYFREMYMGGSGRCNIAR